MISRAKMASTLGAAAIALAGCAPGITAVTFDAETNDAPPGALVGGTVGGAPPTESARPSPGQLTVKLYTAATMPPSTPVVRYQALLRDRLGRLVADMSLDAPSGEAEVTFGALEAGEYRLFLRGYDAQGREIEQGESEPVVARTYYVSHGIPTRAQAFVRFSPSPVRGGGGSGGGYAAPLGKLGISVEAIPGLWLRHDQAPARVQDSLPAYGPLEEVQPGRLIDDEDALDWAPEVDATVAGHYVAFTTDRHGDNPMFIGRATFAYRQGADPENGARPTLVMALPGASHKFYLNDHGALVATSGAGASGKVYMVDPEPVPGATLADAAHPDGFPARRFFFTTGDHQICDLYFGAEAGSGLRALSLPVGPNEVLHIRRP